MNSEDLAEQLEIKTNQLDVAKYQLEHVTTLKEGIVDKMKHELYKKQQQIKELNDEINSMSNLYY